MEKVLLENFNVAGNNVVTDNKTEFSENGKIPKLWADFFRSNPVIKEKIYGVYSEFKGNAEDEYKLTVGFKKSSDSVTENEALFGKRNEQSVVSVNAGSYLVLDVKGKMPESMINAWHQVWSHFREERDYVRSFKTDFEEYESDKSAKIYIGIEEK